MGVPITLLDYYCPEQFEILGMSASWDETDVMKKIKTSDKHRHGPILNGKEIYRRIFIKRKDKFIMNEEIKKDILEDASIIVTGEAGYSCYPDDIEEYYKKGMYALQLAKAFMNDLRKKGWFDDR